MKFKFEHLTQLFLVKAALLLTNNVSFAQDLPRDVIILEVTPVHVRVDNPIAIPRGMTHCKASVFNRLPVATPWSSDPERITWNVPSGKIQNDNSLSNSFLKEIPRSFQCQPDQGQVLAWEGNLSATDEEPTRKVTCEYDITLARRVFDARKYLEATISDLDDLPKELQEEVLSVRETIEPKIAAIARGQIAADDRLVPFLQLASNYCEETIKRGINDSKGKYITRYDIKTTFQEQRGWCGPRSSLFRAFCLAVGIPAREVNGYALQRLNVTNGEINMSDTRGVPDPTNDANAHVWAEVYFPNVGWVEINVGARNCFDVPSTFIRVSGGNESPQIFYHDSKGRQVWDGFGPRITVTPR